MNTSYKKKMKGINLKRKAVILLVFIMCTSSFLSAAAPLAVEPLAEVPEITDTEAVAADKALLSVGYAEGDSQMSVTQSVYLAAGGANGTVITWVSDNPEVISTAGVVTRPAHSEGNAEVTLTATITKNAASDTKAFDLTVIPLDITDTEAVAEDKETLNIGYASGNSADNVTQNLNLPIAGANGTAISWLSDKPGVVSAAGTITRPVSPAADETVTLTASISKGEASDTKVFTVIVKSEVPVSIRPGSATFMAPNQVKVTGVPAGAAVKVYHQIAFESEYINTLIGQSVNTSENTGEVVVVLDNPMTGSNSVYITFTEPGKLESTTYSCGYNYSTGETYMVLGGTSGGQNAPLRIEVGSLGSMKAFLWQTNQYVRQYYGENCWGTNLYYTVNGVQKHLVTPYYGSYGMLLGAGTQTKVDDNTVKTVWLQEDGDLRITQTIRYLPGQMYYEKNWELENLSSDKTISDVRLIHGGDTYFGGYDSALSYWNGEMRMVYVKNQNMQLYGLMGFAGSVTTPADHYFGGRYYTGNDFAAYQSQLPDNADPIYQDAGYQLQWDYSNLAAGESWEVISYERWTESGFLQAIAPAGQTVEAGNTVRYQFIVQSFMEDEDTFDLSVTSSNGWETSIEGGNTVTINGNGGTANVTVELTVPADASAESDTLELIIESQSDEMVGQVSRVETSIIPVEPEEPEEPVIEPSAGGGASLDGIYPKWPSGSALSSSEVKDTSLLLTWSKATDNRRVTKYRIYMNDTLLTTVNGDVYSYLVTGLKPGTEYTFRVEAGDAAGNWSGRDISTVLKTAGAASPKLVIKLTRDSFDATAGEKTFVLDACPFIPDGSSQIFVPLRFVSEALGAKAEWLQEKQQVRITYGTSVITLTLGSKAVDVNGKVAEMSSIPESKKPGRTFVPAEFFSQFMNATVEYDKATGKVTITQK